MLKLNADDIIVVKKVEHDIGKYLQQTFDAEYEIKFSDLVAQIGQMLVENEMIDKK